jgi:sortase A
MRDKRPVDELTVEELERILAIKKREDRQQKLKRMERSGRIVTSQPAPSAASSPPASGGLLPPELERLVNPTAPADETPLVAPAVIHEAAPRFEEDSRISTPKDHDKARFWRSFFNQMLFLVEALAVIGLVYLGYQMVSATSSLQQETNNAQRLADQQRKASLPTLAPTPQIRLLDVVLPGGHILTDSGEAQFNFNEVPEALRSQVAAEIFQPINFRPPRTPETALALSIPQLNVDQTIVQGTDWEALKLGIGQLLNGAKPGDDQGNVVLAGHDDVYGEYFRYLDQLKPGDEFYIRTETQIYTYRVTGTDIVAPNDVSVMDTRAGATATLISCYPYHKNDKRIVVYGERIS